MTTLVNYQSDEKPNDDVDRRRPRQKLVDARDDEGILWSNEAGSLWLRKCTDRL